LGFNTDQVTTAHSRPRPQKIVSERGSSGVEATATTDKLSLHYGGNPDFHDRFRTDIVDSGNNTLGRARVEAMNRKSRGSSK
jgi:hypothetical protein